MIAEKIQYLGKRYRNISTNKDIIKASEYLNCAFSSGEAILLYDEETGKISILDEQNIEDLYRLEDVLHSK